MAEEIKVGDWISYSVSGLPSRGKVVGINGETYTVQPEGLGPGQVAVVGRSEGDGVKKVAPPKEE
jgi:hypothetical protein